MIGNGFLTDDSFRQIGAGRAVRTFRFSAMQTLRHPLRNAAPTRYAAATDDRLLPTARVKTRDLAHLDQRWRKSKHGIGPEGTTYLLRADERARS